MRRIFFLLSACLVTSLILTPSAMAQQGPECPTNQVNVLLENEEFICVPGASAERTPAQNEAVANDPRPNAETPLIEKPRFCDEFYGSQASAQEFFEDVVLHRDDNLASNIASNLDPDNDGVACEGLLPDGQEDTGAENQEFTPERADICDGLFPASPPNSNVPGEGDLECFETAEQAKTFAETGVDFRSGAKTPQCDLSEGCFLSGNGSPEEIVGGTGPDYIGSSGGGDALYGLGGDDWLEGGDGNDLVLGDEPLTTDDGDDFVTGGTGDDQVLGAAGNDYVSGDAGNDTLEGGSGNDYVYAADGEFDRVSGGPGNDLCVVDSGDDVNGCEEVYTVQE